jgi:molybdopterin converting factor small subunit
MDHYRDVVNTPAFFALLPPVAGRLCLDRRAIAHFDANRHQQPVAFLALDGGLLLFFQFHVGDHLAVHAHPDRAPHHEANLAVGPFLGRTNHHHLGLGLGEPRRGRGMAHRRPAPAGDLRGRDRAGMSRVQVELAALLRSYTGGASVVAANGTTLGEVLDDLDRRFRGIRFRIVDEQDRLRPHVRFFVNGIDTREIATALDEGDRIYIVGALSGG